MALFAKFEIQPVAKATKVEKAELPRQEPSQVSQVSQTEPIEKLPVPKGHGIWRLADFVGERDVISAEREVCYCCKGTDFWIAGTEDDPYKLCRKCRPPIPGAERIPEEQTA
jgi:hypothetical protein